MSKGSKEERILAYLTGECDEKEAFEIERLCRNAPDWQKDKVRYGQILGLVEDAFKEPSEVRSIDQEHLLSDMQRGELRNLLSETKQSRQKKKYSETLNVKKHQKKPILIYWAPLTVAATAVAIAYWATIDDKSDSPKEFARAESTIIPSVPVVESNQTELFKKNNKLGVTISGDTKLALQEAIQESADKILNSRTIDTIQEMENKLTDDLLSGKEIVANLKDSQTSKSGIVENDFIAMKKNESSLADAFEVPKAKGVKHGEVQLRSTSKPDLKRSASKENVPPLAKTKVFKSSAADESTPEKPWISVYQNPELSFIFNEKGDSLGKIKVTKNSAESIFFKRANWTNRNRNFKLESGTYEIRLTQKLAGTLIINGALTVLDDEQYELKINDAWKLENDEKREFIPLEELIP